MISLYRIALRFGLVFMSGPQLRRLINFSTATQQHHLKIVFSKTTIMASIQPVYLCPVLPNHSFAQLTGIRLQSYSVRGKISNWTMDFRQSYESIRGTWRVILLHLEMVSRGFGRSYWELEDGYGLFCHVKSINQAFDLKSWKCR